jgi:hypothetical protein
LQKVKSENRCFEQKVISEKGGFRQKVRPEKECKEWDAGMAGMDRYSAR